jgi:tetratricopeptide (TPR) repeat protein
MMQSKDLEKTFFSLFMLFGVLGYMVIASFSFPKERIFHSIFLMLIAASVVSIYYQVIPRAHKIRCRKLRTLKVLLVIFLLFSVIVGIFRFNSEVHTRSALAARKLDYFELVIQEIDRADSWFYTLDPASTPLIWYKGMANLSLGRRAQALDDFKKAYEHHPNHIHVLNNLGTCYALLQNPEKAIEFYRKALAISPGFERCLMNLHTLDEVAEKHTDVREISRRSNL